MALRRGELGAPSDLRVKEAVESWLAGARSGVIRTRSGRPYKPSTLRGYEQTTHATLLPRLGARRLSALDRASLQDLIDDLVVRGCAPSTVRNAIKPLQALFRRAVQRQELAVNPTLGLALPSGGIRRERVARPAEARALLEALQSRDQSLWACAIYGGLRRGELQALRWRDIDLEGGRLRVNHGWDRDAGLIEPKSKAAIRTIPVPRALRVRLAAYRLRQLSLPPGFVFSATGERPFDPPTVSHRAKTAWARAGLVPIALHECRHTYAAFMIAAGVNLKALSTYMGHSSITVTLDRYGHLLPGNEDQAAAQLDDFLGRTTHTAAASATT